MEPLTTAAIAVGIIVATKALEKTTEKATEAVLEKTGNFLKSLRNSSPETATAIEKVPEGSLDYGRVVLEVEEAAKANPEVAQTAEELVAFIETEPDPRLNTLLQAIKQAIATQQPTVQNQTKLAEKIASVIQAQIVKDINYNINL